jgi:hypothetical protein
MLFSGDGLDVRYSSATHRSSTPDDSLSIQSDGIIE